ncbi:MAG: hypothetical protein ABSH35_12405 [Isosphaeraceae bacterium]|jgi:hypothetical protein
MWTIPGKRTDPSFLRPFDPVEILYEFDGPRIFTTLDVDGERNLVYWSDEDESVCRYVVAPTTQRILDSLQSGIISVHDALNQPRCWLCDVTSDGEIVGCQLVDFEAIPNDALPALGTMLWPSLEPLLTLRAIGQEIAPGQIPGSVIRSCVEGVQKSFKILSEYVLGQKPQAGRPDEFLRRLFDLPTQRLAFSSFEISFRMPIAERSLFRDVEHKSQEAETLEEVGKLLNKGLKWLTTKAADEGVYSPSGSDESAAVLRALKEITPSSHGNIERLELKGQLLGPRVTPLVLERHDRQRVNTAIRNLDLEPQVVDLEGRIRELDKDRLSFELREIHATPDSQRFVFDEELREDVTQAFNDDVRVRVAGRTFPVKNLAYALALSRVSAGTS